MIPDDEPERNPEHDEHVTDALAYMMAAQQDPIDRAIKGMELHTAEAHLREMLAELHRRHYDEAAPIIERLAKIEAMKPRPPAMVYRDVQDVLIRRRALFTPLPGQSHVSQVMQDLAAMIDDAKADVTTFNGHFITRRWVDEEGGLASERVDPKDFYAKPEDE